MVLLTDGDNNAGKIPPTTAAEAVKALKIRFYAIGAGINGIAPAPVFNPEPESLTPTCSGTSCIKTSAFNSTRPD